MPASTPSSSSDEYVFEQQRSYMNESSSKQAAVPTPWSRLVDAAGWGAVPSLVLNKVGSHEHSAGAVRSSSRVRYDTQRDMSGGTATMNHEASSIRFQQEDSTSKLFSSQRGGGEGRSIQFEIDHATSSSPRGGRRGSSSSPLGGVRLYHKGMDRALAKQQWACVERARRLQYDIQREGCTFQPEVSPFAAAVQRPRELSPEHRAASEVRRRWEWRAQQQAQQLEEERALCTFHPLTLRTAEMHASALVQRHDLHELLHLNDLERRQFREKMQQDVIRELQEGLNRIRPDGTRAPKHTYTQQDVEDIVDRLYNESIGHAVDDPAARGITFHPAVNPLSDRIVAANRMNETPQEIVERLLSGRPTKGAQRRAEEAELEKRREQARSNANSAIAAERRRHFAKALYALLAEAVLVARRSLSEDSDQQQNTPLSEKERAEFVENCALPASSLWEAADALEFPRDTMNDIRAALHVLVGVQNVSKVKVSRDQFVDSMLKNTAFGSTQGLRAVRSVSAEKTHPENGRGSTNKNKEEDQKKRTPRPSPEEVVKRLERLQAQTNARREEAQREAAALALARDSAHSFQPNKDRPPSRHTKAKKQAPPSAAPVTEIDMDVEGDTKHNERIEANDHCPHCPKHRDRPPPRGAPPSSKAATDDIRPTPSKSEDFDDHRRRHLSAAMSHNKGNTANNFMRPPLTTAHVYRDVISEHAALGDEGSLTEFGRLLMARQLQHRMTHDGKRRH